MVKEAIDALGSTTNTQLRDWILRKYPGTNPTSISAHITMMSVNHPSRSHYGEARKPRAFDERFDVLYRPESGRIERYDPSAHGKWILAPDPEGGRAKVMRVDGEHEPDLTKPAPSHGDEGISGAAAERSAAFAEENHLRDFLAEHPELIEPGLSIFVDDAGVPGIEYVIPDVGRIDLLCVDAKGGLVVVELKVGRGHHAVAGQILLYKNWLERNFAQGRTVRGFIIAESIDDRIRLALAGVKGIELKEYKMEFRLVDVERLE